MDGKDARVQPRGAVDLLLPMPTYTTELGQHHPDHPGTPNRGGGTSGMVNGKRLLLLEEFPEPRVYIVGQLNAIEGKQVANKSTGSPATYTTCYSVHTLWLTDSTGLFTPPLHHSTEIY